VDEPRLLLMRVFLRLLLLPALLALPACRSDKLALEYHFVPDTRLGYRLTADAAASWDIGGQGSGSYTVTFDVVERIQSVDSNGATVSVVMTPVDVEESGLPSPGSEERSFTLEVGPNGEVLEVLEVDGVAAAALDHDELAFIGTYRPPLPLDPVELRQSWNARQKVNLDFVSQELSTTGRLLGLRRDEHRLAELGYSGRGPLTWETTLPQGRADLAGSTTTEARAEFDIDGGYLRSASSTTAGDFDVRVIPTSGNVPITGTLHLDLELHIENACLTEAGCAQFLNRD
jgi:hypothetical protein